jgi:hypothetical protein
MPALAVPRKRIPLPLTSFDSERAAKPPALKGRTTQAADMAEVGGLSRPSKMPWYGWSIPTTSCKVGGRLREVPGSVCHGCYAHKRGNYRFNTVQASLQRRLDIARRRPKKWASSMASLLRRLAAKFTPTDEDKFPAFRWHDSGDLQGGWHLRAILEVSRRTLRVEMADKTVGPIRHWLPTREYGVVNAVLSTGEPTDMVPSNLVIRLSAHMVDGELPSQLAFRLGVLVSGVHSDTILEGSADDVHRCPAYTQGGKCVSCRTCWDGAAFAVSYPKH